MPEHNVVLSSGILWVYNDFGCVRKERQELLLTFSKAPSVNRHEEWLYEACD